MNILGYLALLPLIILYIFVLVRAYQHDPWEAVLIGIVPSLALFLWGLYQLGALKL